MKVPASVDFLGKLVSNHPKLWVTFGNIESKLLAPDTDSLRVQAPIYICGLARAGSTVLLEMLARHPDCTAHRYQDFPFLFTPYAWNTLLKLMPFKDKPLEERAHGDGIMVSPKSPEAMEEMLWMAFFSHLHDASQNNVLDRTTSNPDFERFYRSHIKKLLFVRGRSRYVSKGNYNVSRMAYVQKLYGDAKFIIPVRDPVSHVASLMKQHKRFCEAGTLDPRATAHMNQVGHFEFGLNRIPINTGNAARIAEIQTAWSNGEEIRGLALYWDMIYRFVHDQLKSDPQLAKSTKIIAHHTLCAEPQETIRNLLSHCQLTADDEWISAQAATISERESKSPLNAEETALIKSITAETAARYNM